MVAPQAQMLYFTLVAVFKHYCLRQYLRVRTSVRYANEPSPTVPRTSILRGCSLVRNITRHVILVRRLIMLIGHFTL